MAHCMLRQKDLAETIGVSESYLSRVLHGRIASSQVRGRIARVLGVSEWEIFPE